MAAARPVEAVNSAGLAAREPLRIHAGGPSRSAARQEIHRIARWYAWGQTEIDRALLASDVASTAALGDEALARLLARMQQLETCAQDGLDSPDSPPAR
ncbi:MAG: hypothetical protein JNM58_00595 [Xanthomonadaceae bacterium]|nr:hypothetical protein [Xanthomonadaceae bacterium]